MGYDLRIVDHADQGTELYYSINISGMQAFRSIMHTTKMGHWASEPGKGIILDKLATNDLLHVTVQECKEAIEALEAAGNIDPIIKENGIDEFTRRYWDDFALFIRRAVGHNGFIVG